MKLKYFLITLLIFLFSYVCTYASDIEPKTYKGNVVSASARYEEESPYMDEKIPYQDVRVKINDEGKVGIVSVKYELSYYGNPSLKAKELKIGDKVYVTVTYNENGEIIDSYIGYINNERYLIVMIAIYSLAIILIGGLNGLRALVGLIITILTVFFGMIPLIYEGYSPILVSMIGSVAIIVLTFIIVAGFSKKTLAAILGTIGGIIVAGLFALIFGELMKLTGACEHAQNLSFVENGSRFNFEGIMIAGIIVGALGACMDVGMSIASALHELSVEGNGMTIKKLIKSGMNIGKDVMGTMTNTLILAYVGSSLIVILLFKAYDFEAFEIANNMELVLEEVLRAIAGSFGLVFTIPITTIISSLLMGKRGENVNE